MQRRMFLFSVCAVSLVACQSPQMTAETAIFLVRHAEKETGPDPSLTDTGHIRAQALADRLANETLTEIYSTDYARTRETAQAVADHTGLSVTVYNPSDLPAFAASLTPHTGRILIVGHSNTTPAMVSLLGGEAGAGIDDAAEFDRLYVLSIDKDGNVTTQQETYGD